MALFRFYFLLFFSNFLKYRISYFPILKCCCYFWRIVPTISFTSLWHTWHSSMIFSLIDFKFRIKRPTSSGYIPITTNCLSNTYWFVLLALLLLDEIFDWYQFWLSTMYMVIIKDEHMFVGKYLKIVNWHFDFENE